MSAYALPGMIFPSVSGTRRFDNRLPSLGQGQFGKKYMQDDAFVSRKPDFSIMTPSFAKPGYLLFDNQLSPASMYKETTATTLPRRSHEVRVTVIDAKLDPMQLIKSLTPKRKRSSGSGKEEDALIPPLVSAAAATRKTPTSEPRKTPTDKPPQDAIQFEFSISYFGRTYKATRTLPSIVKLRKDLIGELHGDRANSTTTSTRRMKQRCRTRHAKSHSDTNERCDDTLPEIPDFFGSEMLEVGFAGRGFSMMRARLRTCYPAMEEWLRDVIGKISPDSQALSQFLWEPVSQEVTDHISKKKQRRLVSINEEEIENLEAAME